jgi:hypothetical protein
MQELLKYCQTERQKEVLQAIIEHGSQRKAATALGVCKNTVDGIIKKVKRNAARLGHSPGHDMTHTVPDGYLVKGVSTLYANGEVKAQWVKSSIDHERQLEIMKEAIECFKQDLPRYEPTEFVRPTASELMNMYVITDYHFAQLSDGFETRGDNYDLHIAERQLIAWFETAIKQSPDASVGVFAQCGDFMHFSGSALEAVTETSRNLLDVDSRLYKMVRVVIRVVRKVLQMLLEKHEQVHVIMAEGNHDISASVYMREWLHAMYENEPRITIDRSADPYYAYEFGNTSVFIHHGHKRRVSDISKVFEEEFNAINGKKGYIQSKVSGSVC